MPIDNVADSYQLETLVDSIGLRATLELLASICHDKASHIACNWQDEPLAKVWRKQALRIERSLPPL